MRTALFAQNDARIESNRNGCLVSVLVATAAATTAAAPATTVSTTPSTTATTAATATIFTRPGLVHRQRATVVLGAVDAADRGLRFGLGRHLYKPEALAPARVAVID